MFLGYLRLKKSPLLEGTGEIILLISFSLTFCFSLPLLLSFSMKFKLPLKIWKVLREKMNYKCLSSKDKRQCWPLTHTFVSGSSMGRVSLKLFLTHFMIEQINTYFDIDDTTFVSHCGRKQLQMWNGRRPRILWVLSLNWTYQYELIIRFMLPSSVH